VKTLKILCLHCNTTAAPECACGAVAVSDTTLDNFIAIYCDDISKINIIEAYEIGGVVQFVDNIRDINDMDIKLI
jgi:hypothetical protein